MVGQAIQRRLGSALTGPIVCAAPNLGAGDNVGKPLRHRGLDSKAKRRRTCAQARAKRIHK
eukprot:4177882-Pyramimonas_sp.AAC.1